MKTKCEKYEIQLQSIAFLNTNIFAWKEHNYFIAKLTWNSEILYHTSTCMVLAEIVAYMIKIC